MSQALKTMVNSRFISLILLIVIYVSPAHSMSDAPTCPALWQDIVIEVESRLDLQAASEPFLFADRDGNIFDCLGASLDEGIVLLLEEGMQEWPLDRTQKLGQDPAHWPINICSMYHTEIGDTSYHVVTLPLDPLVVRMPICITRVLNSDSLRLSE
ncbi:hypothetical protein [Pararhodobacter zhoushanensis]|uniref:Uncharacterized protein n=1 Tax=Pararhodobacter zhoushanensis TaxID=2479545 RepID=A0ABT3H2S1_9RHOB|nr:hypothetical protein [Pararhodobacter zhoushanensis]MCW1934136.1 hypothetical protein [Pararhodobacter zhoushanensis]